MVKIGSLFITVLVTVAINAQVPSLELLNSIKGRLFTPQEGGGYADKIPTTRIINGVSVPLGMFPWIAALLYKYNRIIYNACGGSVITSKHILTAAHCINKNLSYVRLAENDFGTNLDGKHLDFNIEKAERHEEFYDPSHFNDIGIVTLSRHVIFTNLIRPIALPHFGSIGNFDDSNAFVAGWGATLEKNEKTSKVLKYTQVPLINNVDCLNSYKINVLNETNPLKEESFDERVLCAGYERGGHNTCKGDSGGPLMYPFIKDGEFIYYQIGIVSWSYGCAQANLPTVFTRVESFIDWIQRKINE